MKRMPRSKHTGTLEEIQDRARERAAAMAERHPGVRFSLYVPNPLGVKEARDRGVKGAGLPQAIFDRNAPPVSDEETLARLVAAYERIPRSTTGYVTFTALQAESGIPFQTIFGVVRHLLHGDPPRARLSVNGRSEPTVVRFVRDTG